MADIGRSSFIPKEAGGFTPGNVRRKRTFHVFGFLSATMLIGSLILGIGVYVLQSAGERELVSAKQKLSEQKDVFKPEYINEVRQFDRRLQAAEAMLLNHIAPLKIFAALEDETKERVQFTSFTLTHNPSAEIILELQGVTPEFRSLALQEIEFGDDDNEMFKDIVFKQVALEETENAADRTVTFSLKGTLGTTGVRYDGTSAAKEELTTFSEVNGDLAVEEAQPQVLGESIIREDI